MGKTKTPRKSCYGDGSYMREIETAETVGELIERLRLLPPDLPLGMDGDCAYLKWYNVGRSEHEHDREHLVIEIEDYQDSDYGDD